MSLYAKACKGTARQCPIEPVIEIYSMVRPVGN